MPSTTAIKVTDDRQGRSFRTGINGRYFDIPVNQRFEAEELLVEHLRSQGVAFDELEGERASRSKEGSGEGLAPQPLGPHDVRAPGTDAKSLGDRPLAGDQPGDVTESGGVRFASGPGPSIEEDAKVSDIRVAAERASGKDAPVAEKAGEGEGGTEEHPAPQGVQPTHRASAEEKKARKAKKANARTSARAGTSKADAAPRASTTGA